MESITIRVEAKNLRKLNALAIAQHRSTTELLNHAIKNYIELQRWQMKQIDKALEAADKGDFATDAEVKAEFARGRKKP
jgi:RHH-type rel operon transcriptional repressor/antitoxin RelB